MGGWIFKRGVNGTTEFWTGETDCCEPVTSPHRCDAYVFESSDAALQCADTHRALKDSEVWKLVQR